MRFLRILFRACTITSCVFAAFPTFGQEERKPISFNYRDAKITKVLEDYAAKSGQRFIVDPMVRGVITIINPSPISLEEAFNQLSTSLAVNGIAISTQDSVMVVKQARSIQRDLVPVVTEVPTLRPERMVTWVIPLKHASAEAINRQLRILTSKDGELVPYSATNQIIVTDWTPNLHRIAAILKELDIPRSATPAKAQAKASSHQ